MSRPPTPSQWTTYSAIVGSVLARYRANLGIGQVELSQNLSISQATWSRIERGAAPITLEQLSEVAHYLGVHPHQVVQEADIIVEQLRRRGVEVYHRRPEQPVGPGLILLGAGALAGLVALLAKGEE
ncbi:MAG: helix-turn-helix transcriptional regulator [Bradymonadales bacterium]|nr:helix-turn-helix transcriptional regulator [Bradymonadales bacterium]